jgi:uncharacterized ferritin-like protein (DUF455 family)
MDYVARSQVIVQRGLLSDRIEDRLAGIDLLESALADPDFVFQPERPAVAADQVAFPSRPLLVEPRQLPRRGMHTPSGLVAFLHAVAHIEFTAIALALDAAYRFDGLPDAFYRDWLGVAVDEARHFRAVRVRLNEIGSDYGDLPAHRGLWELAEQTASHLLARMALVPRFMEARGLDVTPAMIEKLKGLGDQKSIEILEMILREEIGHVALGSYWFRYAAEAAGESSEDAYFRLINQFIQGQVRGPFNTEARRKAGFSDQEMQRLTGLAS